MEFSFDRSKNAQSGANDTQNQTQNNTSGIRPGPDLNSVDPSTIANERLRKAIERNRSKQAGREAAAPNARMAQSANTQSNPEARFSHMGGKFENQSQSQFAQQMPPQRPTQLNNEEHVQNSFFTHSAQPAQPIREQMSTHERIMGQRDTTFESNYQTRAATESREQEREQEEAPRVEVVEPQVLGATRVRKSRTASTSMASTDTTPAVVRRAPANPDNTEFVPQVKRPQRKVATQVNYSTNTARKKSQSVDPKYTTYLVKACWVFCGLMVLRLIFASGGVTDYYSQKSVVNTKQNELEMIQKDNSQLVREIERMKNDTGYQKKLVRDNLGFIAKDEFLVLFPKEI